MARNFNGSSTLLTASSLWDALNDGDGITTASISFWGYRDVESKPISVGFLRIDGHRFGIIIEAKDGGSTPKTYGIAENSGDISQGWHKTVLTGWHHFSLSFNGNLSGNSNRLVCYLDGVAKTLDFESTTIPTKVKLTSTNFDIGRYGDVGLQVWTEGSIAEVSVWNSELNSREHLELAKGIDPATIRAQSLIYLNRLNDLWTYDNIGGRFHTEVGPTNHAANPPQIIRPYKFKMIYGIPEFIFRRIRMSLKKIYNPRKIIFQTND